MNKPKFLPSEAIAVKRVLENVERKNGRRVNLTAPEIARRANIDDENRTHFKTRMIIKELIRQRTPIVSGGRGFRIADTVEELKAAIRSLQGRRQGIQERIDDLVSIAGEMA